MKHLDVIIWEQGDRVLTPCGPGAVRRGAANPTAEPSPVVVRLDGGRLDQFPGAELQPETPVPPVKTAHLAERIECAIGLNVDCGGAEGVYRLRDLVMAEVQPVVDRLMRLEQAASWEVTCVNCAQLLDRCYDADTRAERAEQALAEAMPKPACSCGGRGYVHYRADQHEPIGETP